MENRIVVGLGNPGSMYESTRHNVGFAVVDELCTMRGIRLQPGRFQGLIHTSTKGSVRRIIVKPLTYMNNSGETVAEVLDDFGANPEEILVIVDDLALPLGSLRLRRRGTDGGHNGLRSIIYHLQSTEFPRLRCGIGPAVAPSGSDRADFVLSPFDSGEKKPVENMIHRAAVLCNEFIDSGLGEAVQLIS